MVTARHALHAARYRAPDVSPSAIAAMEAEGIPWLEVVDALVADGDKIVLPSARPGVSQVWTRGLSVLLTDTNRVIGVRRRWTDQEPPQSAPTPQPAPKRKGKGKRGGVGRLGPRSYEDLLAAVKAAPGWTIETGGKHYRAVGPEGQRVTLAISPSDHRSTLNIVRVLRKAGLDLRKT